MEVLLDLIKVILPAALVLYAMYMTFTAFLKKDTEQKLLEIKSRNQEATLPLRLQAYERVALLLERVSPQNLILRIREPEDTVAQLHENLLFAIREELNHNVAQQIYVSEEAWILTTNAIEEVISIINAVAQEQEPGDPAIKLARDVIGFMIQQEQSSVQTALTFIRKEVQRLF